MNAPGQVIEQRKFALISALDLCALAFDSGTDALDWLRQHPTFSPTHGAVMPADEDEVGLMVIAQERDRRQKERRKNSRNASSTAGALHDVVKRGETTRTVKITRVEPTDEMNH